MQVFTQMGFVLPDCKYLSKISLFFPLNTEKIGIQNEREREKICAKFRKSEVFLRNGLVSPLTQLLIAYIIISCPVLLSKHSHSHQPHLEYYTIILHMLVCSTPMQSMKKAVLKFILLSYNFNYFSQSTKSLLTSFSSRTALPSSSALQHLFLFFSYFWV